MSLKTFTLIEIYTITIATHTRTRPSEDLECDVWAAAQNVMSGLAETNCFSLHDILSNIN